MAALPAGVEKIPCRWDAGYFAADLAAACVERGVDFALGVKRTAKVMAAAAGLGRYTWTPAVGMEDTELAVIHYLPGPWPRARASPALPGGPGSRSSGSRPPGHGNAARSTKTSSPWRWRAASMRSTGTPFILTSLDVSDEEKLAEVEWWYRHRTDIEELNRNAKLGTALRHLPSSDHRVNSVWMWAGLLGCAISAWMREITDLDHGNGRGRRTVARLRREVIRIPARITRRAGEIQLGLPPAPQLLATVLPALQRLPAPG